MAIQFGIEKGLTPTEVIQMGLNKNIDVLESNNETSHNTNANNSSIAKHHIDKLKNKLKK